jgi:LmbE family N-acetylglucosaminyl deacetylase
LARKVDAEEQRVSRVLVLSPHPDDESLGCGGTLSSHVADGDSVHVIFLTSGEQGGHGRPPEETACVRELEARAAAAILGLASIEFWREPDGALRATPQLVERVRSKVHDWQPELIYVTYTHDLHADHRAATRAVQRALAGPISSRKKPTVLMFEVWTPLQRIDRVVDISLHMETKLAAIRAHASQCAVMRFDEAFEALARYRGEMHSWPGGDYAEIFTQVCGPS